MWECCQLYYKIAEKIRRWERDEVENGCRYSGISLNGLRIEDGLIDVWIVTRFMRVGEWFAYGVCLL